ncbi:DUF3127 domain-containing protein [Paracoccaceae bacterium]|nr:DUF3127 domain-containing protein [Paracoccaceae bacterium]
MDIKGKIVELLPLKSGQSANGEWRKQEYILETDSNYPKKICFMAWGDKIDQFALKQGDTVEVAVDLESREYNERWYADVKAWKVSKGGPSAESLPAYDSRDD